MNDYKIWLWKIPALSDFDFASIHICLLLSFQISTLRIFCSTDFPKTTPNGQTSEFLYRSFVVGPITFFSFSHTVCSLLSETVMTKLCYILITSYSGFIFIQLSLVLSTARIISSYSVSCRINTTKSHQLFVYNKYKDFVLNFGCQSKKNHKIEKKKKAQKTADLIKRENNWQNVFGSSDLSILLSPPKYLTS